MRPRRIVSDLIRLLPVSPAGSAINAEIMSGVHKIIGMTPSKLTLPVRRRLSIARGDRGFAMGDVVNLNRIRKRVKSQRASQLADENRAKFGRTRLERTQEQLRADQASKQLDQHRIDPEDRT